MRPLATVEELATSVSVVYRSARSPTREPALMTLLSSLGLESHAAGRSRPMPDELHDQARAIAAVASPFALAKFHPGNNLPIEPIGDSLR